MMVEIKNRYAGEVICSGETLADAVRANIADLSFADLSFADLSFADLRSADLRSANLRSANLRSADLSFADLSSADLRSANLRSADLRSADLTKIQLAYQSHDLLAEILRRAAGDDIAKLKVAGFVLVSRDKCWKEFAEFAKHDPLGDWALYELAKWVQPDDDAPEILRERAVKVNAVSGT